MEIFFPVSWDILFDLFVVIFYSLVQVLVELPLVSLLATTHWLSFLTRLFHFNFEPFFLFIFKVIKILLGVTKSTLLILLVRIVITKIIEVVFIWLHDPLISKRWQITKARQVILLWLLFT